MALDVVVVLALFAFAWLGAHRGGAEAGIRLGGLAAAYGGAYLAGAFAGDGLASALGLAPWLGSTLAGLIGFVAAQALVEVAARRVRSPQAELGDSSRVVGAALGIARGALLLLPVLWLASFTESVRRLDPAAGLPDLSGARASAVGQALAGAAAERVAASGDGATRVTAKFVAAPAESVAALSAVVADPRVRVLQSDVGFWDDLTSGDVEGALARPTFTELAGDPALRAELADLGLVAEASALDARQFHAEMARVMRDVAPRIARIQADPAFQALLADEALLERVRAGDTLALLADPRIQQIVASAAQ